MNLKKRLYNIPKLEMCALGWCIAHEYPFAGGSRSETNRKKATGHFKREQTDLFQKGSQWETFVARIDAQEMAGKHKIFQLNLELNNFSDRKYESLLKRLKKHSPRIHAKLTGKRPPRIPETKEDLEGLFNHAENYVKEKFDENLFNEFRKKMHYKGSLWHGRISSCLKPPQYIIELKCESKKKARSLFEEIEDMIPGKTEEIFKTKIIKSDNVSANYSGFDFVNFIIEPSYKHVKPHKFSKKQNTYFYYTDLAPTMAGLSRPALREAMYLFDNIGIKECKGLWRTHKTILCVPKTNVSKKDEGLHEDLYERLYDVGSDLLNEGNQKDFFKIASITHDAFDLQHKKTLKRLYELLDMRQNTYCWERYP